MFTFPINYFAVSIFLFIFATDKAATIIVKSVSNIDGPRRPTKPFVGLAKGKRRYERYSL